MEKVDALKGTNFFIRIIKKLDSIQFGLDEEKEYFIENLSMLLAAGINVTSALSSIKVGMKSPYMQKIVEDLKKDIEEGSSLWKAFAKTEILPEHIIVLFRIGEMTGKLPENLKLINIQQQKERIFRAKIKSAMMYPVLVLTLTAVIGIGIAWFILPRLSSVFASLRLDLPWITKILIKVGNFLGEYGLVVIPLFLLALFFLIYFVFIFKRTNFIGQWILFRIPGIKDLIQQTELSRFGHIMGQLLSVNLPVTDAIESLKSSTTILAYKKLYAHMKSEIEIGSSFQKAFNSHPGIDKLIPAPIQQMIASGEQSGCLPKLLKTIGEVFEEKTDATAKNLSTILEPLLLVVIWGGVMSVALAVLLPIYSLIGGIGKGPPKRKPSTTIEKNIEAPKQSALPKATYPTTQGNVESIVQKNNPPLTKVDIFEEETFDRREWTPTEIKNNAEKEIKIFTSYEELETNIDKAQEQINKQGHFTLSKDRSPESVTTKTEDSSLFDKEDAREEETVALEKRSPDLDSKNEKEPIDTLTQEQVISETEAPETTSPTEKTPLSQTNTPASTPSLEEDKQNPSPQQKEQEDIQLIHSISEEPLLFRISPQTESVLVKVQKDIIMLNVRQYPSTSAKILKQIFPGEAFPYLEWQNGWYKIFYEEELSGWVSGQFVEEINQ